mmetsp:Transcript_32193/g.85058  ORF Transcript_32193/g.85058 Transcript_32193/m.85058 type:complete len:152 (-) Transcript_32193:56-511(-)
MTRARLLEAVLVSLIAASGCAAALRAGQPQPVDAQALTVEALQRDFVEVRAKAATLVEREHGLLREFGNTVLGTENLYQEAQRVIAQSKQDVRIAKVLCSSFLDCGACAEQTVCGWCAVEGQCVPGDRLGVYAGVPVQCSTYHYSNCALPS